ncbi:type IV toxin-antitoxin system AbiEi family antitoxin domain-containing protein [Streptomyces ortus]|uniref:Type IV toxin-antitoxin system AbiEi family antitoxin domain-containing protein n=1 Tax=Streptomyces ortus TaxID=2867268 RepID=A0ABT3UZR2_9ACTN|nr:type IV toxin-antitoxin system AbiEi family antitoxin domain-containing protein [Streptomyces ortus]MCX4233264.1 type IV toxin-antitoxin system AbiEi family antitoxin domain-containing protein [Streptomyces ortus]
MSQADVLRKLGERASDQWGLVTAAQAKLDGIQGVHLLRLERAGLLENVGRGVYRIAAGAPPEHLETKVAWLRLDPETPAWQRSSAQKWAGVVSHASACELHALGDLPADRVELIVPARRTTRDESVLLHRLTLEADDVTMVEGLPVTTAERTITDLLRSRADGAHIGTVIADADRRGLIDIDRLADRVVPFVRGYGLPAAATGEELLQALCQQAGRSLLRHETEQAAAAGFASALSALEELADPASLEKVLQNTPVDDRQPLPRSMAAEQTAVEKVLQRLGSMPLEKILQDAAARQSVLQGQTAVEKVLQRLGSKPLEKILQDAAARRSLEASSGLGQALKGLDVWRPVLEKRPIRPRALERAERDEEEAD